MPQGLPKKEATILKVLEVALLLDFKRGHLRWTISDLARASGVKRPLIYYYFGKDKQNVLLEAVHLIGEEIMGLSVERMKLWREGLVGESMRRSRLFHEQSPHIAGFYFSHRFRASPLGEAIRKLEQKLYHKLQTFFPQSSDLEIAKIYAFLVGSNFSPFVQGHINDPKWFSSSKPFEAARPDQPHK